MRIGPQRPVDADAIVAPPGYRVEALITGLAFPSAISFGPGGELYLAESGGVTGAVVAVPRVLRIDPDGSVREIGRLDNPISGLVYRNGELLIGEEGPAPRILRVTADGEVQILVEGLPGGGDYGLSGLAVSPDGALVFGLGTRTNSGVVGLDNVARGWVALRPAVADVPGADAELVGVNYVTGHPASGGSGRAVTGAFKAFGDRSEPGETVRMAPMCSGGIYRLATDAARPERLAWGLRHPVGLSWGPDGRLYVTEEGMEERGSRPIAGAPDNLWGIQPGGYYGWPDYASGLPVTDPRFRLPGHPQPRRLLKNGFKVVGPPRAAFPAHSGVGRLDFSTSDDFGFAGQAFVALSGPWSGPAYPAANGATSGHRIVRVDPRNGEIVDFLVNRHAGPASAGNSGGLERPFDVRFDPGGEVLYVVDLGEIHLNREFELEPFGGTGVVWRITKARPMLLVPPTEAATGVEPSDDDTDEGTAEAPVGEWETDDAEAEGQEPQDFEETGVEAVDAGTAVDDDAVDRDDAIPGVETAGTLLSGEADNADAWPAVREAAGAEDPAAEPDGGEAAGSDLSPGLKPDPITPTAAEAGDIVPEIEAPATPVVETTDPEETSTALTTTEPEDAGGAEEPSSQAGEPSPGSEAPPDAPGLADEQQEPGQEREDGKEAGEE